MTGRNANNPKDVYIGDLSRDLSARGREVLPFPYWIIKQLHSPKGCYKDSFLTTPYRRSVIHYVAQ